MMDRLEISLCALVVVAAFLALCFLWLVFRKKLIPHQLPLPPGPKGRSFFGSALEIDRREPWLTFAEWKASYGSVVSCKLLGRTYVIVNSQKAAKGLFEQRSNMYSSRPAFRICSLFGMDANAGRPSRDDVWSSESFHNPMVHKHYDSVVEATRALLADMVRSPEYFENHMRTYAASVVMSVTYGYHVVPRDGSSEAAIEEMTQIVTLMTPGRATLLRHFPQLLSLPSWFQSMELWRWAKRCREASPKIRDAPFQFVKECLSKSVENDSMVARLLKDKGAAAPRNRRAYEQDVKDCATSSFIAGVYTMQAALSTLVLALVLYPEVQDRAQAELDRVVGRSRLPAFADRESLSYIEALLRETLRWGSLVPMAIPRVVTKDIIFEQRLIPQGSVVIQNLWGMSRDEDIFSDPTSFRPERHLDAHGNLIQDDVPGVFFGYGPSACPGRYLADSAIWLAAARILSTFRLGKAVGPAGYETDVFSKFMGGVARRPVPFSCRIAPRSEEVMELLG